MVDGLLVILEQGFSGAEQDSKSECTLDDETRSCHQILKLLLSDNSVVSFSHNGPVFLFNRLVEQPANNLL